MITTADLIFHLENVLEKLKEDTLDSEKIRDITLLYVKHKHDSIIPQPRYTEQDAIKYLTLGWYIHNFLLKKLD